MLFVFIDDLKIFLELGDASPRQMAIVRTIEVSLSALLRRTFMIIHVYSIV